MSRFTRKAFLKALLSSPCLLLPGCASWFNVKKEAEPSSLPKVPIADDVIVAEVSLIKAREPQLDLVGDVWQLADEQITPLQRRRDLDANGFRCGRFGGDLPGPLRSLLEIHDKQMEIAKSEGEVSKEDPTLQGLRMQLRAARKGEIRVRGAQSQVSVLLSNAGIVTGGTFPDATCSFLIRGYPASAASAEIELTPYIEYGMAKRNWDSSRTGELEMTIARPQEQFGFLRMNSQLGPGELLLVGPSAPAKGMGGVFFHEQPSNPAHSLLLVRIALAQSDSVFRQSNRDDS